MQIIILKFKYHLTKGSEKLVEDGQIIINYYCILMVLLFLFSCLLQIEIILIHHLYK